MSFSRARGAPTNVAYVIVRQLHSSHSRKPLRNFLCVTLISTMFMAIAQKGDWWQQNYRKNRYEGIDFSVKQSAPAVLNLVSFVGWKDKVATKQATELVLQFFSAGDAIESVVARELSPVRNYRMEPIPPSGGWRSGFNSFEGWDTSDVLVPKEISLQNIGVLIRLNDNDPFRDYVAPAVVVRRNSPPVTKLEQYEAHFVPSVYLSGGTFAVHQGCGAEAAATEPIDRGDVGKRTANFSFPVPLAVRSAPSGFLMLKVEVTPAGATHPVTREYCFAHRPNWPPK